MRRALDVLTALLAAPLIIALLLAIDLLQRLALGPLRKLLPFDRTSRAAWQAFLQAICGLSRSHLLLEPGLLSGGARPLIIIANHQSPLDIGLLFVLLGNRSPKFVARPGMEKGIPGVSFQLRHNGHVCLKRGDREANIEAIRALGLRIEATNGVAVIFPEGTKTSGALAPFRSTGLRALLEAAPGALVVPLAIDGSHAYLNRWFLPLRAFGTIQARMLAPVTRGVGVDAGAILESCRLAIESTLAEWRSGDGAKVCGACSGTVPSSGQA